jgi:sulfatase maturation enzyme AslB (radical SAM superfamily)
VRASKCGEELTMDFATTEIFQAVRQYSVGRPISPVFLNILVTSVCDMRCTHCFFTEELDDRPRKKLQMKADEIARISETLGGNLGVLVLAGGEPFRGRTCLRIVRLFYENNKLDSVYLMSNGQIHQRIFPDVTRILDECPKLNVTVALGIDGMKDAHEKIRRKEGSWDKAIHTARTLQQMKREQYPQLDIQTCTCVMRSNEDTIFDWYDFLKHDLKPDKVNINYIRPPSADPMELQFDHNRYSQLANMILDDTKNAALKNNYGGKSGFFKAAVDIYMHDLIAKTKKRTRRS